MNVWGLITGVLILLAAYIHHSLGTRKIWLPALEKLDETDISERIKGTLGFMWHGITLWSIAMGLMAIYAVFTQDIMPEYSAVFYLSICLLNTPFAVVATFYGKVVYGKFRASPQWLFFWPISITSFLAFISV
ncbi:MAG: hypothetical protein COC24_004855 [Alphaproteobacteria bacterium]|nr:hypothetical protein [Alphaproteobacteria bacterium]